MFQESRRLGFRIEGNGKQTKKGTLIIRIGFWGPLYYSYNTKPPNSIGDYLGP